jgi:hypothetical protein
MEEDMIKVEEMLCQRSSKTSKCKGAEIWQKPNKHVTRQ